MRSRESISVTLLSDSDKIRSFPVWLKVKAYKKAWIAEKNYNSGSRVELLSVRQEYIDSAKLNSEVVEELPKGKRLAIAVAANEILTTSHIEDIPLVEQGEPIKILSAVKNIRIVAIGRAKSDGDLGDTVFVQLKGQKNVLKGKVIAKQLVVISG
nr:flagellar basal body P-ring formation chaperone FlgA [Microbulbifer rhizosphaerae]